MKDKLLLFVPGLAAGAVGGLLGVWAFGLIVQQGFYALVLPGAFAGFACGFVSERDSKARGILNGLSALGFGLLAEWRSFPFKADESLGYFLGHVQELTPLTLAMTGLGGFLGFWWGRERIRRIKRKPPQAPSAGLE